jgi:NAD(P)-dependent dehydrogenase (short-subunit alcohol dehydrogenase family)
MKTAFITGANRGLGRGFVEYFLGQDFLVFAGVRNPDSFDKELQKNKNLRILKIDVSDDDSIIEAFKTVSKEVKHLDYLVNNAGVNKDSATNNQKELVCNLKSLDRKSLLKMFDVNSISPLLVVKTFLSLLENDKSFVVNISSCRASYHDEYENKNGNYGYRASKTALNMLTHCSLFDLPENVRTFAVHPGGVKTDMNPDGTDMPIDQAEKIIVITKKWKDEYNGKFLRYDNTVYPL